MAEWMEDGDNVNLRQPLAFAAICPFLRFFARQCACDMAAEYGASPKWGISYANESDLAWVAGRLPENEEGRGREMRNEEAAGMWRASQAWNDLILVMKVRLW